MKRVTILLVVFGLVCIGSSTWAGRPEYTYEMPHIPDELIPKVDGALGDAIWVNYPMEYAVVHPGGAIELNSLRIGNLPADASDFSCTIKYGWNETTNRIYIAIEEFDNLFYCEGPVAEWWCDDMWEIYVDAKLWNAYYMYTDQLPLEEWGSHAQQFLLYLGEPLWGARKNLFLAPPHANQATCQEPYFKYVPNPAAPETAGSKNMTLIHEVYFQPWEYIHQTDIAQSTLWDLEAGQTIGLGISRYEDDLGGANLKAEWNTWGGGDCCDSSVFSEFYLLAPGEVPITAVESSTWGAIKATFTR